MNKWEVFVMFMTFITTVSFFFSIPFFAEYNAFREITTYTQSECIVNNMQIVELKRCKCGDWTCLDAFIPLWNMNGSTASYTMFPEGITLTQAEHITSRIPINQTIPCLVNTTLEVRYPQYEYTRNICVMNIGVFLDVKFKEKIQTQLNIGLVLIVPLCIELLIIGIGLLFHCIKRKQIYKPLETI